MQSHPRSCCSASGNDGYSEHRAGSLNLNLDSTVLPFAGIAELARSLAIRINRRSTSPAHRYSCYGQVIGTWRVIRWRGNPNPYDSQPKCLSLGKPWWQRFVSPFRHQDPGLHTLVHGRTSGALSAGRVPRPDCPKKGRVRPFRLHIKVRCQPTSLGGFTINGFVRRCSGSPWMGDLRSEAFHTIPPAWVKANKRIWLSLVPAWTKACSWWVWFELGLRD